MLSTDSNMDVLVTRITRKTLEILVTITFERLEEVEVNQFYAHIPNIPAVAPVFAIFQSLPIF